MNKKLKTALTRSYSEQGFAFPVAIGMGLIMLLVAATMIARSHGDQTTASVQKATAQSLGITEGGITRSLSKLKQLNNGSYLRLNYDTLNTNVSPQKTYLGADATLNSGDEVTTAVDQWSNPPVTLPCATTGSLPSGLVSGSIGSGTYTIKSYRYRDPDGNPGTGDETGNLLIEGTQASAASQIQISMPITRSAVTGSFPGLYASNNINLGNNDVLKVTGGSGYSANVICKDCVVPSGGCSGGVPTQAGLNSAIGKGPNSEIDGNIFVADPQLPLLPTAPATACSVITLASGTPCSVNLGSVGGGGGNNPLPSQLPRLVDAATHKSGQPYHYVINNLDIGNNVIHVTTTTSDPIYLYVSGDVSLNGNGGIAHTGSPELLRLYGKPADANNANDQTITISGGSSTSNMFIYAPDATVGINGGSQDPDIQGAVWAKAWNGSSSNNAEIRVPDNMPTLLGGSFSGAGVQAFSSGSPSTWQRQPISQ
jgi:hypothetical protein